MNPDPNSSPNPNRNNPNNLLDTIILLGYNVRIGCLALPKWDVEMFQAPLQS